MTNINLLPFGDAHNTTTCRIHCFKAGRSGGSVSEGWSFPDGTRCGEDHNICIKGQCKEFNCVPGSKYQLNSAECHANRRTLRDAKWTPWKSQTGCSHPCLLPGNGLRLVSRECLISGSCLGLQHSVQLCHEKSSNFRCTSMWSPDQYADKICSRYQVCFRGLPQ